MGRPLRYSLGLILLAGQIVVGQDAWTVRTYGGIGIGVAHLPSVADYANILGGAAGDRIEEFQSMFDLNGGVEMNLVDGWSVGLDYVSSSRTIETQPAAPGSGWVIEPQMSMPTVVVRHMTSSGTMAYGFGGGVGYHSGRLMVTAPGLLSGTEYSGNGIGLLAQAVAYTYFDEMFAGMIAVDLRWSSIPELKDAAGSLPRTGNGVTATLKTFSLALRFGLSFQL